MRQTDSTKVGNHPVGLMGQRCGASEFWRQRIAGFIFSWWCVVFFLIPVVAYVGMRFQRRFGESRK